MTACVYVTPPLDPNNPTAGADAIILADTVATLEKAHPGAVPITPASITRRAIAAGASTTPVRKLHVMGNCAVAMAGELPHIKFALSQLHYHLPTIEEGESGARRAMRYLGDTANSINAEQAKDVLRCIGIEIMNGGTVQNNMGGVENPIDLKYLGKGGAIGTGAASLVDLMKSLDAVIAAYRPGAPASERTAFVLTTVNSVRLAEELVGVQDHSWGGYFEGVVWRGEWLRGPPTVHFFLGAKELGDGTWTTALIPRVIAYDPGGELGRVCTLWCEGNSPSVNPAEFLLTDHLKGTRAVPTGTDFWTGWRAQLGSISVISPISSGTFEITPFNFPLGGADAAFVYEAAKRGWRLPADAWEQASKIAMDRLGRKYRSTQNATSR